MCLLSLLLSTLFHAFPLYVAFLIVAEIWFLTMQESFIAPQLQLRGRKVFRGPQFGKFHEY